MAYTAHAYNWDDVADEMPVRRSRPIAPPQTENRDLTWHEQQLERLFTAFIGEEVAAPKVERLPLAVRIGVVLGGACLGWAMPIALVSILIR